MAVLRSWVPLLNKARPAGLALYAAGYRNHRRGVLGLLREIRQDDPDQRILTTTKSNLRESRGLEFRLISAGVRRA